MQDNTLARALRMAGADAVLLPAYTPIRVDEDNVSIDRVFLGGINVYLDSKLPGWNRLPRFTKRWLDHPGLVRWLSKLNSSTDASALGPLTTDLLKGSLGPQRGEIQELIRYLCDELKPDTIIFSNALLSGIVPELRQQFSGLTGCLLQGDDIFLDGLKEPWKTQALRLLADNAAHFDLLLTHSDYYAQFMQRYLGLSAERFRQVPLTIDDGPAVTEQPSRLHTTVGYFARICPEKGAFWFLDAAERVLSQRADLQTVIAGYLPEAHRRRFETRIVGLTESFGSRVQWLGSPDSRQEKFRVLTSFDWLCVPTEYHEPKGLYVLEAALAGVPSLLPAHGAFPERISALGTGTLYDPCDPHALDEALLNLPPQRDEGARESLRQRCLQQFGMRKTGVRVLEVLKSVNETSFGMQSARPHNRL